MNIGLVLQEYPGWGASGGIGVAFKELSEVLVDAGHSVTIFFLNKQNLIQLPHIEKMSVNVIVVNRPDFTTQDNWAGWSFAAAKSVMESGINFDFIHFHDYQAVGYHLVQNSFHEKFRNTAFVCQMHGPRSWAKNLNGSLLESADDAEVINAELFVYSHSQHVVFPSKYLKSWCSEKFGKPQGDSVSVIPNIFSYGLCAGNEITTSRVKNLLIVGRHEQRKGIDIATEAIQSIIPELIEKDIQVFFLGSKGLIQNMASDDFIISKLGELGDRLKIVTNAKQKELYKFYATANGCCAIIPAPEENLPYAVLEPMLFQVPTLSSSQSGSVEFLNKESIEEFTFPPTVQGIAQSIKNIIRKNGIRQKLSWDNEIVSKRWLQFHKDTFQNKIKSIKHQPNIKKPKVTVGLVHYERPNLLWRCFQSVLRQTYEDFEIIICDDGSRSQAALDMLDSIKAFRAKVAVKVLQQENRYLGAARNSILKDAKGSLILFVDDDDVVSPTLLADNVAVVLNENVKFVVNHSVYFKSQTELSNLGPSPVTNFVPTGIFSAGSLVSNSIGTACTMFQVDFLKSIGGFTELHGVGFEDYEVLLSASCRTRAGVCIDGFLAYQSSDDSMVRTTDPGKNWLRISDKIRSDKALAKTMDWSAVMEMVYFANRVKPADRPPAENQVQNDDYSVDINRMFGNDYSTSSDFAAHCYEYVLNLWANKNESASTKEAKLVHLMDVNTLGVKHVVSFCLLILRKSTPASLKTQAAKLIAQILFYQQQPLSLKLIGLQFAYQGKNSSMFDVVRKAIPNKDELSDEDSEIFQSIIRNKNFDSSCLDINP